VKLSEAILKGCEVTYQARGMYFEIESNGDVSACALGAACIGSESLSIEKAVSLVESSAGAGDLDKIIIGRLWDDIGVVNPVTGKAGLLFPVIVELNDYHMWSREMIAEWLKGIGQ